MVLVSYKPIVLVGLIVMVRHFLHAGQERETLLCMEDPMATVDFITALFSHVDEQMRAVPKHPEAHLWPSEVGTLGLWHALKGVGNRAFYRWLTRDSRGLFPRLPERTRLLRLFRTHQDWTQAFWAAPTVLGVIDTYGIEVIHPMREGRSPQQKSVAKGSRIPAGLSAGNCVSCCISGGWWWGGRVPPRTSRITPCSGSFDSLKNA